MRKVSSTNNPMEGYEKLAIAIVEQAADDYRDALTKIKENPGNVDRLVTAKKDSVERFFHSREFGIYTRLNPDKLMRRIHDDIYGKPKPQDEPIIGTCRDCKWCACRKGHIECDNLFLETEYVYKVSWNKPCWEWEPKENYY